MDNVVAVYGSLRSECYNNRLFHHFPRKEWKVLGKDVIKGFSLFSLGGFPGVERTGENELVIEVYRVSDSVLEAIRSLEGYDPFSDENWFYNEIEVETKFGQAKLYEYVDGVNGRPVIEHGDWVEYKKGGNDE
jgi:gamma-glutamylcyclotransferase (GGCT)/AIG2-like uncharacterized protein YtfP